MAGSSKRARTEDEEDGAYEASSGTASSQTVKKTTKGKATAKSSGSSWGKTSSSRDAALEVLKLNEQELSAKSKEELLASLLTLQLFFNSGEAAKPDFSAEQVQEKTDAARTLLITNLKSQMKWKPSCKTGGTKWSYTATVPTFEVFVKLFDLDNNLRGKQTKITTSDFAKLFSNQIHVSMRYGSLSLCGENVTIRWRDEACEFTASGLYGV